MIKYLPGPQSSDGLPGSNARGQVSKTNLAQNTQTLKSLKTMSILWRTWCNTIIGSLLSGLAAVNTILHDHFRVSKRCARWMPYQLPGGDGWRHLDLPTRSSNKGAVNCVSVLRWRFSGQVQENQKCLEAGDGLILQHWWLRLHSSTSGTSKRRYLLVHERLPYQGVPELVWGAPKDWPPRTASPSQQCQHTNGCCGFRFF